MKADSIAGCCRANARCVAWPKNPVGLMGYDLPPSRSVPVPIHCAALLNRIVQTVFMKGISLSDAEPPR